MDKGDVISMGHIISQSGKAQAFKKAGEEHA